MAEREPIGFQVVAIEKRPNRKGTVTVPVGQRFVVRSAAEQLAEMCKKAGRDVFIQDVYFS